jgi:hypothetical protein
MKAKYDKTRELASRNSCSNVNCKTKGDNFMNSDEDETLLIEFSKDRVHDSLRIDNLKQSSISNNHKSMLISEDSLELKGQSIITTKFPT